jgi:hypothetical protein
LAVIAVLAWSTGTGACRSVGAGAEAGPPEEDIDAPPPHDDNVGPKPPAALCARMTFLRSKEEAVSGGFDPRACIAQFRSAREVRPDLYPCLSLCVMRAENFLVAGRCTTMCAPAEATCESAGDADAVQACVAKFKKLQDDESAASFACVAKCGSQQGMKAVVECMGTQCGL